MKELMNDAVQYVIDNNLEDEVNSILIKIIKGTRSLDILSITVFICVSIYINDKYK